MSAHSVATEGSTDAQIVAVDGRRFLARTAADESIRCFARERLGTIVCGDRVRLRVEHATEALIEQVHPRSSLVYRSDHSREKAIAANVDTVVVVLAVTPVTSDDFVDRCLAAAEHAGLQAVIVLNKIDLDPDREIGAALKRYSALGYPTLALSAHATAAALRPYLDGRSSVLIGRSGVGKSTILNALVPQAGSRTAAISRSGAGRHTTTRAYLFRLDDRSCLIDSPGMNAFGVQHIGERDLAATFPEFRAFLGQCRFSNCRHAEEPGCALHEAVRRGEITVQRMHSYGRILKSMSRSAARRSQPARHRYQQDQEEP